jgi:ssDNA-binding replication factor A large subunit
LGIALKLNEIEPESNVSEVIVRVISKAPPRLITTRSGRKTQLTEVLVTDGESRVILSLWGFNEGSDLSAGKVIKITNGWAKEWQGKLQLSLGREGTYEEIADDGSIPTITEIGSLMDSDIPE